MKQLLNCSLFYNLKQEEIEYFIKHSKGKITKYTKENLIFNVGDTPRKLYILIEGEVAICKDNNAGKRTIINKFQKSGEIFGEVFIFMNDINYINYALAFKDSHILEISKSFFYKFNEVNYLGYTKILHNMLLIISGKAYYLNQRLQLMSGTSLRQKVAQVLLDRYNENKVIILDMSREEMADSLGTTRPSLSRELAKMHDEGLIDINGRNVRICNVLKLKENTPK